MQKNKWLSSIGLLFRHPKKFSLMGLTFGFIGAILLALSVEIIDPWVPPPALTHATINQEYFYFGIGLLAMGFLLQMVDIIKEK
jgi:uncharacterized membrane protein YedE/YeeE